MNVFVAVGILLAINSCLVAMNPDHLRARLCAKAASYEKIIAAKNAINKSSLERAVLHRVRLRLQDLRPMYIDCIQTECNELRQEIIDCGCSASGPECSYCFQLRVYLVEALRDLEVD